MDLVAYVRVSSETQLDGFGLVVQERAIRQWARTQQHRIVAVHRDEGRSGTLPVDQRAGLTDALGALPVRARGLVVARLDRLARHLTVQEAVLLQVWRVGADVFTVDGPDGGQVHQDDDEDPMRTAMRQMAGVFAQLERAQVVKRLRDGRRAKADSGRHAVGAYAFGYAGSGRGRERDAAPVDVEQRAVQRICELRGAGASYRAIAAALDSEGLRPRRAERWSSMSVRNVALREPAAVS